MNFMTPDREPEPEEPEPEIISDALLYRHLIINHVGLRDQLAMAALRDACSRYRTIADVAKQAYAIADAMLKARDTSS